MGKSVFDKYSRPKSDPVKAAILERINAEHLSVASGSKMMGVAENTYIRRLRHQHTEKWAWGEILRMCRGLKVDLEDLRGAVRY